MLSVKTPPSKLSLEKVAEKTLEKINSLENTQNEKAHFILL